MPQIDHRVGKGCRVEPGEIAPNIDSYTETDKGFESRKRCCPAGDTSTTEGIGMIQLLTILAIAFTWHAQADENKCYSYYKNKYVECVSQQGQDLSGRDLEGIDWNGADLRNAKFVRANLKRAHLVEANAKGADFRMANMYAVNLYGANLQKADLRGANLSGSSLYGADLSNAIIDDTTALNGAVYNLEKTKLPAYWGKELWQRKHEAIRRGMLRVRY